jgi:hypothetical protein
LTCTFRVGGVAAVRLPGDTARAAVRGGRTLD